MDFEGLLNSAAGLFAGANVVAVVTDSELRCRWASKTALERFPTLALPDGLFDLVRNVDRKFLLEKISDGNLYTACVEGEPFNQLEMCVLPFREEGRICGCLVVLRSMAEAAVEQNGTGLEDIFSAFSSGYKMPLTVIFSTLGLLARQLGDRADSRVKDYLRLITQNCYRLLRLSNNLTEISRYRAGKGEVSFKRGDICSFLSGLCNAVSILTSSINIPLEAEIPEESIILSFDPDKLSAALLNLISNACKFTREGNHIRVRLEVKGEQAVISVSDRGQGISAEKLAYVFDPYFASDPEGRPYNGMGLGLSRVKYIVAMHGGTVAVHSQEGQGTTVAFTLPIKQDSSLPDYMAGTGADYLADRFSPIYIELSDVCRTPLP